MQFADCILTIRLVDINEAPVIHSTNTFVLSQNSRSGTLVGVVEVSDPDIGQTLTFQLSGNDAERFSVDSSGRSTVEQLQYLISNQRQRLRFRLSSPTVALTSVG